MTAIVGMALGKREIPDEIAFDSNEAANVFFTAQNKVRVRAFLKYTVGGEPKMNEEGYPTAHQRTWCYMIK